MSFSVLFGVLGAGSGDSMYLEPAIQECHFSLLHLQCYCKNLFCSCVATALPSLSAQKMNIQPTILPISQMNQYSSSNWKTNLGKSCFFK